MWLWFRNAPLCLLICNQKLNASNISVVRMHAFGSAISRSPQNLMIRSASDLQARVSASTFVVMVSDLAGSAYQRVTSEDRLLTA